MVEEKKLNLFSSGNEFYEYIINEGESKHPHLYVHYDKYISTELKDDVL